MPEGQEAGTARTPEEKAAVRQRKKTKRRQNNRNWANKQAEIKAACTIVNDPKQFTLYDHGHVRVFEKYPEKETPKKAPKNAPQNAPQNAPENAPKNAPKNQDRPIIADILFTDLKTIPDKLQDDLTFFLGFLEILKKFVNKVGAEGWSCGGWMWGTGWRKSMTRFEIVGRYINRQAIADNLEEFKQHIRDADWASQILWDLFYPMGNQALKTNQDFMSKHAMPAFSNAALPKDGVESSNKKFFSSHLTFTSEGFYNLPHLDPRDNRRLPFAFLLCIPTFKDGCMIALESDGYDVTGGDFVFPQCKFEIKFKPDTMVMMIFAQRKYYHGTLKPYESDTFTKLGMSMQIAQKMSNQQ
ncbi:hypothetical protein PTTG_07690 [Puccinia triticina 1-1 BBBD Race 1]|uniref:Tet-like 2OG-Fe(II) oxygenase domain-containing protein n=1 Tax=Puccinia triticina (isolate 1-1 / race 1 (BBBD)) TaxID=630390 RepID=A0A180H0U4_PUCT1|nr:hypothetical protein PTTG_07690 [Puccinia triticina 1-1 BBBD Race 1]